MIRKLIIPGLLLFGLVIILSLVMISIQKPTNQLSGGSITGNEITAEPEPLKLLVPDTLPYNAILIDSLPDSEDSLAN
ncbi:MAG: hypothetical protein OCC49_15515 [Fibrobacterales bacterium]